MSDTHVTWSLHQWYVNIVTNLSDKAFKTPYKNFHERKKLLLQDCWVSEPIDWWVSENVPPYEYFKWNGSTTFPPLNRDWAPCGFFNPSTWNVKGLGNQKKNTSIKASFRKNCQDIVLIQKTQKRTVDRKTMATVWGRLNCSWITTPSIDASGGTLIAWKVELFKLVSSEHGTY